MEIDRATADDLGAVACVHVRAWQHAYRGVMPADYLASLSVASREAGWRRSFHDSPGELLVAKKTVQGQGQVVGFVSFGASRDDDAPAGRGEVWALYVDPGHWSTGAGRLLWRAALERLQASGYNSVSLWVVAGNERAWRFYRRAGFREDPQGSTTFEIGGATVEEQRLVRDLAPGGMTD